MNTTIVGAALAAGITVAAAWPPEARGADSWPRRFGNAQNTTDAGDDLDANGQPFLFSANVKDLAVEKFYPIGGNATPIVAHGLLFHGSAAGIHVIDLASDRILIRMGTGGFGIESTGTLATVTVPDGAGGTREENRFYIGVNSATDTLHCLNVDAILADATTLDQNDGSTYVCDGPLAPFAITASTGLLTAAARASDLTTPRKPWPLSLEPPLPGLGPGLGMVIQSFHGTPLFRADQPIRVGDAIETRDVLFTPSMGIEPSCSASVLWAIDAYTGEKLWQWDPVVGGDGRGAVMWFSPATSADGEHLYVTTGDCVDKPHLGDKSESIVSLDPVTGEVQWYRQARLVDTRDFDIGNSPTVVDVEGPDGCHVVVHTDKDGCFYAYDQEADVPEIGDPGYDPLRPGQQRLLWRQCVARSGTTGGFNGNGASFHGRWLMAQSQRPGGVNAYGFFVDACTGDFLGASSDLASGYSEGAVAGGMWFIPNKTNRNLQVVRAGPTFELLATVDLPGPAPGGGGPAIVDGTIYVPSAGVAVVRLSDVPGVSAPVFGPPLDYDGPYPHSHGTRDDFNVIGPIWPVADVWDDSPLAGTDLPATTEGSVLSLMADVAKVETAALGPEDLSPEDLRRLDTLVETGFDERDAVIALVHEERRGRLFDELARIPGGIDAFHALKVRSYYESEEGGGGLTSFFSDVWNGL